MQVELISTTVNRAQCPGYGMKDTHTLCRYDQGNTLEFPIWDSKIPRPSHSSERWVLTSPHVTWRPTPFSHSTGQGNSEEVWQTIEEVPPVLRKTRTRSSETWCTPGFLASVRASLPFLPVSTRWPQTFSQFPLLSSYWRSQPFGVSLNALKAENSTTINEGSQAFFPKSSRRLWRSTVLSM